MPKAIRFHTVGGPEVLQWEEVSVGDPGPGEARVRHYAVGLNFVDVYFRTGAYPVPSYPWVIGVEGAGVVEAVGAEVSNVKPGDRVGYGTPPIGSYCEVRNMPADQLVRLPGGISFEQAAAMMVAGMTVQYLIKRTYKVQPGDTVVWHAVAGGVGLIACQWLAALGVTTIGTVGSDEKVQIAKAHGCHQVINYNRENFRDRVMEITGGAGVPVVYDSVGKDTFERSIDCLRPLGMMVVYGLASGPVPPLDVERVLFRKGSLFLTRPSLTQYAAKREDLVAIAGDLFDIVLSGKVKAEARHRYPLSEAAQAHRDLEARKTTGSVLLIP
ncbi:MAG: quinone oxidoreductase [Betaproteobacteria bacterium]|nr:quinone oxidoreductase [Betaproteobacteria bacterium]